MENENLKRKSNKLERFDLGLDTLLKTKLWEELTFRILTEMEKGSGVGVMMKELDNRIKKMSKADIEKAIKRIKKHASKNREKRA